MAKMPPVLKWALMLGAIFYGIYGLLFLVVPEQTVAFAGSAPFAAGWLRWSGGILLAVAFGLYRVLGAPAQQGIFVTTVALGSLLMGLALILSWVTGESDAATWFILLAIVLTILEAVVLFLGQQAGRNILQ